MTQTIPQLRLDARLAYLDNRVKRAKELNRRADRLAALERARENLYEAELLPAFERTEARLAVLRARVRRAERAVA